MTVSETRDAQTTRPVPRPRSPEDDIAPTRPAAPEPAPQPTLPAPRHPWPAPWRYSRSARPRSEFWDVATASWHSRGPQPQPKR